MSTEYFKEQICEELHGAKAYAKLAIEYKMQYPEWAALFNDMSTQELIHASNLLKMFDNYYDMMSKNVREVPEYITECHEETVNYYAEKYAKVRLLQEAYNKL